MKFISFYTADYEEYANKLKKSLVQFGIDDSHVEYREKLDTWEATTQIKAQFILEKLRECDEVVWIDADAWLVQNPTFFDTITTDIGVFILPQELSLGFVPPPHSVLQNVRGYLQSGTMYFKNTPETIKLLEAWVELNKKDSRQWDQWTLQVALQDSDVTMTSLPPEYVWAPFIEKVFPNRYPVIRHFQASSEDHNIVRS